MENQAVNEMLAKSSCMSEKIGDKLLAVIRGQLTPVRYEAAERGLVAIGRIAMIVAALSGLLYGIVSGVKDDQLSPVIEGLAVVVIVVILQYVAAKFMDVGARLLQTSPSELSSEAFLACIALIAFLAGVVALAGGTIQAIRESLWAPFGWGAALFLVCELIVCLCLNPSMLSINISAASSAGQEAIGVMTFFIKTLIRVVPVVFGVCASLGALVMIWAVVQLLRDNFGFEMIISGRTLVAVAGLWPIAAYLFFIISYLGIDVMRAILALPGKLDALRRDR